MPLSDDELLKKYGMGGGKKDTAPAPESAAAEAPSGDEYWWQRSGRGERKAVAGALTGIPRAINAGIGLVSPSLRETLGDLAERIPGVKRMEEFAAEPSESWAETAGGAGANVLMMFGGTPLTRVARAAPAAAASNVIPGRFVGGGQGFAPPAYSGGQKLFGAPAITAPTAVGGALPKTVLPPAAVAAPAAAPATSAGQKAARAVQMAGVGAATGAATDPQNPGAGAVAGAVGGVAGPVLGRFLHSPVGRYMAGIGLGGEIGYQAYQWLKGGGHTDGMIERAIIDGSLYMLLRGHGSPFRHYVGKGLQSGGARVAGPLTRADPRIGGGLGGLAEGTLEAEPPTRGGLTTEQDEGGKSFQDLLLENAQ